MKWIEAGRGLKVLGVSLAVGLGMTACSRDYTVAYLYATSATKAVNGVINGYAVDYQTGALTQLTDSPIPDNGSNPVAIAASPNGHNLYVLNENTSNLEEFQIGTDGKLYGQNTYPIVQNSGATIVGTNPTALSVDPTGTFLYVTFLYQNGFTAARPGPGGFAVYPISATDGSLGSPISNTTLGGATSGSPLPYFPVGNDPVSIFVSVNNYIYIVDDDTTTATTSTGTSSTPSGVLLVYKATSATTGATPTITQVPGTFSVGSTTYTGFPAGTKPAGVAVDPTGSYIYVTDAATNQLYGYVNTAGTPIPLKSSPFPTGNDPLGLTIDPRGTFLYVANYGSNTISAFAINTANGGLSGASSGSSGVGTGPTCVSIEPALGIYLFTSNNIDSTVSGEQLNASTGALTSIQETPFTAQALPTCLVAVANGAHANQVVDK